MAMQSNTVGDIVVHMREIAVYVCWGGVLDDGVNGLMTYVGGRNACMWISPSMGVSDVLKLVEREIGESVRGRYVWYSLKFDRRMLMPLEKDEDVVKLVRGNDGHAYIYIAGKDGPRAGQVGAGQQEEVGAGGAVVAAVGGVGAAEGVGNDEQRNVGGIPYVRNFARDDRSGGSKEATTGGGNEVGRAAQVNVMADDVYAESDSASESDEDEERVVWARSGVEAEAYLRRRSVWKNVIKGKGQLFPSADAFRCMIWKYAIANKFEYVLERNCLQRIVVRCTAEGCPFYMCVRGHKKMEGMIVKDFTGEHVHSVGVQCQMGRWGSRRMRAKLLARLIDGKVRLSMDYSPTELMKDLELELGMRTAYMQAWRAREYVRMLVMGRPEDHYKVLP